uniref:Uncharacterized protein n=1 Tax=Meloidogyne javanica TaxID=6303 RepID=A0A915MKI1_MELJA
MSPMTSTNMPSTPINPQVQHYMLPQYPPHPQPPHSPHMVPPMPIYSEVHHILPQYPHPSYQQLPHPQPPHQQLTVINHHYYIHPQPFIQHGQMTNMPVQQPSFHYPLHGHNQIMPTPLLHPASDPNVDLIFGGGGGTLTGTGGTPTDLTYIFWNLRCSTTVESLYIDTPRAEFCLSEGGSDDETKVNEVINEGGEGSGTQESGNTRKYKSSKNRRTVRRRERKKKLEGGMAAMEREAIEQYESDSNDGHQPHPNQVFQQGAFQPMVGSPPVAVHPGIYPHVPPHFTPIQEPVHGMPVMYGMPVQQVQGQMPYMPAQHPSYHPQGFNNNQIYHEHIPMPTTLFPPTYDPNEELSARLTPEQLLRTQDGTSQPSNQSRRSGGGREYREHRGGRQYRPHVYPVN